MSMIEIGPRVLTDSWTVTTVGFSVKEAEVAEVSVNQGHRAVEGVVKGEKKRDGEWLDYTGSTSNPFSFFVHGKIQFTDC